MIGNQGSTKVHLLNTDDGVSFIEITGSKNVMATTLDKNGASVHSRNSVINGELVPSQYYGTCVIKQPHIGARNVGVSEDDLEKILSYSLHLFEVYFPTVAKKLMITDCQDPESIFYQYAVGKDIAHRYKYENQKMKEFLYENKQIWDDIIKALPIMKKNYNILSFVEMAFISNFKLFWNSYYKDYMDTILNWYFAGAFE